MGDDRMKFLVTPGMKKRSVSCVNSGMGRWPPGGRRIVVVVGARLNSALYGLVDGRIYVNTGPAWLGLGRGRRARFLAAAGPAWGGVLACSAPKRATGAFLPRA